MSKKYIEKEAAIDYLTLNMNWYDEDGGQVDDWDERKAISSDLLDGIPPADVKPVMRGKWIDKGYHEEWTFECSACGGYSPEEYDFCPHCGAEMEISK